MKNYQFGNKKYLIVVFFVMFINSSLLASLTYIISLMTNNISLNQHVMTGNYIFIIGTIFIVMFFTGLLESVLKKLYLRKSMIQLREYYVKRLFNKRISELNSNSQHTYLSNLSNDMNRYEQGRYNGLLQLVSAIIRVFTSIGVLALIDLRFVFVGLIMFALALYTSSRSSKPLKKEEQNKSKSLVHYTNFIRESLLGFYIIKQNQLEVKRESEFYKHSNELATNTFNIDRKATHIDAFNNFIQTSVLLILVMSGILLAKSANTPVGTIILVGTSFLNSTWPMQQVMPLITSTKSINVILEDFEVSLQSSNDNNTEVIDTIENIRFNNVTLGYDEQPVLENININIQNNEKVLIVGESGAGKSTILKSLRRHLLPLHGHILVNDIDIQTITESSYYSKLAIVDQVGFIFNASLKDNVILYQECNDQDVKAVLDEVGLLDFDLHYSLANDGSNVSGGQRARILLARSLFLNSEIIIGDEIFAALNTDVGSSIEKTMLQLNKTIINVSHIIYEENFNLYDQVLFVKDGNIINIKHYQQLKDFDILMF